jgi:uncharacterized protein YkwD
MGVNMRRFLHFFLLSIAGCFLLSSGLRARPPLVIDPDETAEENHLEPQERVETEPLPAGPDEAMESATAAVVNRYRHEHDLPKLEKNEFLNDLAREHSRMMAQHLSGFGHSGFQDRFGKAAKAIHGLNGIGENVGMCTGVPGPGLDPVEMIFDGWTKSSMHRRNMVGNYNVTGVGVWVDRRGMAYFTQIYGRISGGEDD